MKLTKFFLIPRKKKLMISLVTPLLTPVMVELGPDQVVLPVVLLLVVRLELTNKDLLLTLTLLMVVVVQVLNSILAVFPILLRFLNNFLVEEFLLAEEKLSLVMV